VSSDNGSEGYNCHGVGSKPLARSEVKRVFARSIGVVVLACIAFSFGQYMVAPGGEYTFYFLEAPSFDPAIYRWFFHDASSIATVMQMTIFNALFVAKIPVLVAAILAALLAFVKPLASVARAWLQINWSWMVAALILVCCLGLWQTIRAGVNPGVCC
jgi:hypothetical protein